MKLSKRKEKILKAVVESNLSSGEPISSKAIQQEYLPDVSSATIRNELMSLEELGYLTHLHTSSGRVPTSEGYKKYVSELMPTKKLSKNEIKQIQNNFTDKLINLNDIMMRSAKTISDVSSYASIVYMGVSDSAIIQDIKLINISLNTQLVVVVTNLGVISEMADLNQPTDSELEEASKIMTKLFGGKALTAFEDQTQIISEELLKYKALFEKIIQTIAKRDERTNQIAVAGKEKFMDYPEFEDISKLKKALKLLDNQEELLPMLKNVDDGVEINISVGGSDNQSDCSIVTATYKIKGNKTFSAGVIGPVRMDYAKAISVLREVSDTIKEITNKE